MLNSSRDKNEGRYRSGEGEGATLYMTPDLSYTTWRARVMRASQQMGLEKENK